MSGGISAQALSLELARRVPAPGGLAWRVEHHGTLGSTNDRARELASAGHPEGTVVISDEQTRGRGRAERMWHSPAQEGVYLSVLLRPSAPPSRAPIFGLMAAVAACEALDSPGAPVRIKWPNDLMWAPSGPAAARRKLAGLLAEARTSSEGIRDLILGVGVNVSQTPDRFPPWLAGSAASLRMARGEEPDRLDVAAGLLASLDRWYTLWQREAEAPMLRRYRELALDLEGRRVLVREASGSWEGTSAGLGPDGALRVRPESGGEAVSIRFGDVVRVEAA